MKLTVKSDYATRAVLGLAAAYGSGKAVRVDELAKRNGVSKNYLVQILIELKARGIVKSLRGKDGGYLLAKRPSEISFGEVIRIVHGEVYDTPALADDNCPVELKDAWRRLQSAATSASDEITFQTLLDQGNNAGMYQI
ncbi:MAG: transcriptional regulator, BadM/Rrf2 family protein [Verrucomicrobiales bacterium]|nr:transcriptional regulator, BadM/Rrf2 family protein [Verrucomicrobiales bacterium]